MDNSGKDNPAYIEDSEPINRTIKANQDDQRTLRLNDGETPVRNGNSPSKTITTRFEKLCRSKSADDVPCSPSLPGKTVTITKIDINGNNQEKLETITTITTTKDPGLPIEPAIKPAQPGELASTKAPRKGSTVNWGPIYTVPVFARNFRASSFESVTTSSDVEMTGHRRRPSGINDGPGGHDGDGNRRKNSSVRTIIFGDPMSRRFSQDLWHLKGPDDDDYDDDSETTKVIFFQVFIPFLIAGFGNVGAGLILDYVQGWQVFQKVGGLFVLVASFLGFKGNLEMTLAARLSTQANLGRMDLLREQLKIAAGNIALIQCQAIVVAFLAALIAIASASVQSLTFDLNKSLILVATSLVTASITGLFLAAVMVAVVVISRKTNVNPDNVSTLIAAFLGDLTAVVLIAGSSLFFYTYFSYHLTIGVALFFVVTLPLFVWFARRNEFTRPVISSGWMSIILAMIISSLGGFIFDYAVLHFKTIALFQPIINGVGSNLVAVQASRISTFLHRRSSLGGLPTTEDGKKVKICEGPHRAFFGSNPNAKTARLLLLMVIPGHIIYIVTLKLLLPGLIWITGTFLLSYISVALVQVAFLLYISHITVPMLWKVKLDPDSNAIPCLMSLGDLFGTAFFTMAYVVLGVFNDPNAILIKA